MGTLYKRGNVWWVKYHYQGQRIRESSRSDKKTIAERLLKYREGEIAQGKVPGVYYDLVTFEELAEGLQSDYKVNGRRSTLRVEQALRNHLRPFFGTMQAVQITSQRIKDYIELRQSAGAAAATINRELSFLKRMFKLGMKHTPPKVDRVPNIPKLAEDNVREGFLEIEEFHMFREALPDYMRGLVTAGYKLGCRLGELQRLTWDHVNRKDGYIRLGAKDTKSGHGRTIYLDSELRELIRKQFVTRRLDCLYVFHRDGEPILDFRYVWNQACKAIGREGYGGDQARKLTFHDMRRSAIRNMVRAGIPQNVAMKISGHRTPSIFARYDIVSEADLKQAAERVEAYLEK